MRAAAAVKGGDAMIRATIALFTLAAAVMICSRHWPHHPHATTVVPAEHSFSTAPMVPAEKAPSGA
jgi:hypothetical protein